MKNNKYLYGWALYVNYGFGHGWEYEVFEESYKEIKQRKREYLANCNYPVKISQKRELNPDYN
jgi:hypothetical protein